MRWKNPPPLPLILPRRPQPPQMRLRKQMLLLQILPKPLRMPLNLPQLPPPQLPLLLMPSLFKPLPIPKPLPPLLQVRMPLLRILLLPMSPRRPLRMLLL